MSSKLPRKSPFIWKFKTEFPQGKLLKNLKTILKFCGEICKKNCWPKNWISAPKSSKKHNLQKWTLFSSISNSFRDMTNSLNSPVSHVVKITSQIPVYLEIEDRFPIGKTAQKLKNLFGIMCSQFFPCRRNYLANPR